MTRKQQAVTCEGYILRCRPYLESAWLVDLFTPECGLFSAMTAASRRQGRSRGAKRSKPQIFQKHLMRLKMKPGLSNLSEYVQQKLQGFLRGRSLYAALYINELLLRLLPYQDAHPRLYQAYQSTLVGLIESPDFEPILRIFERILLNEIGVGITWDTDARTGAPIHPKCRYYFLANEGFILATQTEINTLGVLFISGTQIMAIAANDYQKEQTRGIAKHIMRTALAPHLGEKPLQSRHLFLKPAAFLQKTQSVN